MRGRFLILSTIFVTWSYGQSPQLSAPDQTLNPGQALITSLSLASAGQTIAAIQFDLQWDPAVSLQITAGDQLRASSKVPYVVSLTPQSVRCLVAGLNQTAIADGELLKLFLSAGPAASSETAMLRITNISAADPNASPIVVDATPIKVQIQNGTATQLLPGNAVLNAASLSPGPLSPGEVITLFGFNAAAPVSLRIDGTEAPILYAGAAQINAVVPFGLDLSSPATIELKNPSQTLTTALPVAAATPAIFTLNSTGLGPGAILNQDYTPNSANNPALAGSTIMIYGTGFGPLQSPVVDGQVAGAANSTAGPVTATIAGFPATVLYAGAAPGLIAGVIQINVKLPPQLNHNLAASVQLNASGSSTVSGITVAVQ